MSHGANHLTRVTRLAVAALTATLTVSLLTACGPDDGAGAGTPGASGTPSARPTDSARPTGSARPTEDAKPTEDASPTRTTPPTRTASPAPSRPARALTCDQLRHARVQTALVKLPDHPRPGMRLTDGHWEDEDGVQVDLQPQCAIGRLVGDGAADAVGVVKVTTPGTGRYYTLVVWRNDHGTPVPFATESLGDRTPVVSLAVTPPAVTVVYRTRRDGEPLAINTLTRTALYRVAGAGLYEVSHVDTPYAGG
ncbi:hypothetical protein [Streptomyces sp. NPDC056463]|uniref:hypothetical protein n=1 Tax=unclassified Streptomyces TaxID=2593676 RepID=UPI00368F4C6C